MELGVRFTRIPVTILGQIVVQPVAVVSAVSAVLKSYPASVFVTDIAITHSRETSETLAYRPKKIQSHVRLELKLMKQILTKHNAHPLWFLWQFIRLFLADPTIGYWRHHVCPSICPSVCNAAHCGLQGLSTGRVPSRQDLICPSDTFPVVGSLSFSHKTHRKKQMEENANVSFLRQIIRSARVVLRSVIHWFRELLNFGLSSSVVRLSR